MNEKPDELKGGAKEAGDVTDDAHLKREGHIDRAGARIREILEEARAKMDDAVDKLSAERARAKSKEILDEAKAKVDDAVEALKSRLRSDG
ncbi:MAG TPA: hypothetical protein VM388_07625 [Acidimicrobiales bacterium]|nr:hypothetical protein [Acidimicrobiales bacterium]